MKKLKFKVYIGENMVSGQHKSNTTIENVVAIVDPQFPVPHGQLNLNGTLHIPQTNCFWNIKQVATYFCDWFDIVENKNKIVADIYLNTISLHKTFSGEKIVEILDMIQSNVNYLALRTLDL